MPTRENRRARWHVLAVVAGLAVVLTGQSAYAEVKKAPAKSNPQVCASERDLAALNTRVLQTELMVAALSCGERQRYNMFVTSYQQVLTDRGQALQGLFKRAHGAQGATRLNAFITKLANDASQEIREKGDNYCVFAGELFDETLAGTPAEINRIANKPWIANRHGFRPCMAEAGRKEPS